MKDKIWVLLAALLLSIMLVFSGCGSKGSASSLSSDEKTSALTKANESSDEGKDLMQETFNAGNREVQEESENKEQETLKSKSAKTQAQPEHSANQEKKEEPQTEKKAKRDTKDADNPKAAVTISIVGPEDVGGILKTTKVEIDKDDSIIDVLEKVTGEKNIHLEYKGSGMTAYVRGIHNIYEFDRGVKSGWLYRVNGKIPGEGVGTYIVKDGDQIEWIYTIDLGKELSAAD